MINQKQCMKKVILHFCLKHKANWEKIYESIKAKEAVSMDEINRLKDKYESNYISIIDNEYPNNFKTIYMPPLTIFCQGNHQYLNQDEQIISLWGKLSYEAFKKNKLPKTKIYALIYEPELKKDLRRILDDGYKLIIISNDIRFNELESLMLANCLIISEVPFEIKNPEFDIEQSQERLLLGVSKTSLMLNKELNTFNYLDPLFKFEKRQFNVLNTLDYSNDELNKYNITQINCL